MKEGWENLFIYGFFGSLILGGVAYAFKPDTSYVNPHRFTLPIVSKKRNYGRLRGYSYSFYENSFFLTNSGFMPVSFLKYMHDNVGNDEANCYHFRIQTWALEEARRRLEKEGILEDPDTLQKK